ncbi:hypothetical protein K491DRAFT_682948 [Lophiostoma macrostomum CBS 122681]|uniref:Uncharacterized protein n=1 Tax=Lophiostoma macrostomum CBS 122681 TaxID=1314788 RepID=A0A6A6SSG0_9PLEO|nr:hypothetical protein K491DRAFT_682948 [Lophiostoma macrostomum CBS 122681]
MALSTRQPFAEIGTPRLQALSSAKNRQNAITPNFTPSLKQTQSTTGKRRAPSTFDEDDSENVDPSIFNSPSKKSKNTDGFSKPSMFSLVTSPSKLNPILFTASPSIPSVRKALSSPNTSTSTPINHSRGSPKNKRIGLLSKRRTSSSPFRRVDPPSFSHSSPGLPFSIDAALKGSIPDYTPKSTAASTPAHVSSIEESMPNSWFFEIHEDTPEQEAANLMEHSASVLDISSDDDFNTKKRNDELERGKENVPPPDFRPAQSSARTQDGSDSIEAAEPSLEHVKLPRLRNIAQDAMDEDRSPLKDLPASEFYGEGLDANSYVTVDAGIEKPSSLSKEFDFSIPTPKKEAVKEDHVEPVTEANSIPIYADENAAPEASVVPQEVPAATIEATSEAQVSEALAAP